MALLKHYFFRLLSLLLGLGCFWALYESHWVDWLLIAPIGLVFLTYGIFKKDLLQGIFYGDWQACENRANNPEKRLIPKLDERVV